jgi:hypothetical protein
MALPKRAAFATLGAVALALTVVGVVLAATDTGVSGRSVDPLALNGYPPKSAQLHVVISTGQAYDVTANVNVNFVSNAVEAVVQVPMFFSSVNVDLRLVGRHLYVGASNLASIAGSPWLSVKVGRASLYGVSLELTRPDLSLISGFTKETVTTSGYSTTYQYHRDGVSITAPPGLPLTLPTRAAVDFSITVGKQGEVSATSFAVTSKTSHASISATVLSYNRPATIVAPPPSQVKGVSAALLRQILGPSGAGALLSPKGLGSLGQLRLS